MNDIAALRAYYRTVLPYYDRALEERGDLPFWESMARRWSAGSILELGCGTGRVTQVLTARAAVIAVDVLVEMLDHAAQRAPKARLVAADVRRFALRTQFDLVVLADDPMAHLTSTDDRTRAMESIRDHLAADGRVVLEGLYRPRREAAVVGAQERWEPLGRQSLWQVTYRYDDVRATTVVRSWTPEDIDRLRLAGLEIEALWGDFDERPFENESARMVIVARRRSPWNDVIAPKLYDVIMSNKRSTIHFEPDKAVRRSLAEDAEDLEAFEKRRREPVLSFEDVVRSMKRRGKL
jgi:SAM-dependent methyltransferase